MTATWHTARRVLAGALLTLCVGLALLATAARAGADTSWQFAGAQAPDPPSGVPASQFSQALGQVGDIEFWSPNEGLLITGGTEASGGIIPAGLYAYDGVSWHQLSSVCGSAEGRIAYVSADEWWTISDQRPGLSNETNGTTVYDAISLCHFVDGEVVASYALPIEESNSWPEMDAATCDGPDDCWFAGSDSNTTGDAFHLYWDGSTLTEVDNPTYPEPVASMTTDDGLIYESSTLINTTAGIPKPIDQIEPGLTDPFQGLTLRSCTGSSCTTLPAYGTTSGGTSVEPYDLSAFQLSSDGAASGDPANPAQLWAVAAAVSGSGADSTVLRYSNASASWSQVVGSGTLTLPSGQSPTGIAAVPGQNAAWLTLNANSSDAEVEELTGTAGSGGTLSWSLSGVQSLGPDQGKGDLGAAGPISCPAAGDCWLATSQGWLLHWTGDASSPSVTDGYGQSGDPVYNGANAVITYRPADDGTPVVPVTTLPPDNSLENQLPAETIVEPTLPGAVRKVALVSDEKAKLIKGTDKLRFTFKLRAKARVQLVALRRERVGAAVRGKSGKAAKGGKVKTVTVARSRREVLKAGRRSLIVKLSPRRWPTSLKLNASVWK